MQLRFWEYAEKTRCTDGDATMLLQYTSRMLTLLRHCYQFQLNSQEVIPSTTFRTTSRAHRCRRFFFAPVGSSRLSRRRLSVPIACRLAYCLCQLALSNIWRPKKTGSQRPEHINIRQSSFDLFVMKTIPLSHSVSSVSGLVTITNSGSVV